MKKLAGVWKYADLGIVILIVSALWLSGCSIKAPQAPSWDTTIRIPLINKTFSSGELFDKLAADNIETDSLGNSVFYVEKKLDAVTVEDVLAINGAGSSFDGRVGKIKVATPAPQAVPLPLADYVPLIAGVVPDTGLWINKPVQQASTFSQVIFVEGGVIVRSVNNTGFPLDSLTGELRDHETGALIAALTAHGGLADGQSVTDTVPLAGKTIAGGSDLDVYFHTPGGLALSLENRSIDFTVSFTNELYASSVTGKVDQFSSEYQQRAKIADDIHLETGTFASGNLYFSVTNHLPTNAQLDVTFPEIFNSGGMLSLALSVNSGGTVNQSLDLAGWQIQPDHDSVAAQIVATIPSSGDNFVTLNVTDSFRFEYQLSDFKLGSATGVIAPRQVVWNDQQIDIEIPRGLENASLNQVELELTILNHSELAGEVAIDFQASNGKHLSIAGSISAGTASTPSANQVHSDQLADLLSPIPNSIIIAGIATVGDGVTTVHVAGSDYLSGTALISAPMIFKLADTRIEGDKNRVDIDKDVSNRADRLQQGTLKSTISNHLPLGAEVRLYIAADSAMLFTHPLTVIGPFGFTAASVDGDGIVAAERLTTSAVSLSKSDLQVFENRTLYVAPVVNIAGTQNQTVRIRAADYFQISGIVEISARVGGEDF